MEEFPGIDTHTSYLAHPLVLIGLALLVFFGLYKTLSARGVAPPVGPRAGGRVTQALLRHGIVIALLVILLGLGMAFYEHRQDAHIRENLDVLRGFVVPK